MKIGISLTSAYAVRDPREGARIMIERARTAFQAGLDSLFVGDHHATPIPYYQNSPILGRLLAEWGERPCGALYLLPLWNPVLLAEQVGTLASIARGRFILQCAIGPRDEQFGALGVDPRRRPSLFEESLTILRALWRGEEVTSSGPRIELGPVRISPIPPEPVEVWIGATAAPAIDRAARLGDGWLASPHLPPEEAHRQIDSYTERCEAHGSVRGTAAIRRDYYVAADAADARRMREEVERNGYRGFDPAALAIGTADEVADTFAQLGSWGYTDVIVRNLTNDPRCALASIERLATVRERVRAHTS